MDAGSITVNGGSLDFYTFGGGSRNLVILPGLGTRSVCYSAMSVAAGYGIFTEDYTVWVFDRRAQMPLDFSIREMAADVAAAMRELEIGDADVFGASLGGMVAQYLAAEYPELVHALVLGSTAARMNPVILRIAAQWAEAAEKDRLGAFTEEMLRQLYSPATLARFGSAVFRVNDGLTVTERRRFAVQAHAIIRLNTYDILDRIRCPVLVIGVEGDRVVTADASREIAEKLGCELYLYGTDYGHCVFDEAPDYRQRLLEFFRKSRGE